MEDNSMGLGILSEMTRADFERFKPEVAVWPVGATEAHGWHLPFGTDALTVEALTRAATQAANEKGARVLMLPPLPYGIDTNLMAFPYTLTLKPTTIMTVGRDLIDSMIHHGVPKFLMVNGHGGNTATLKTIYREFYDKDIFLCAIDGWALAMDVVERVVETKVEHACEFETSLALALFGELVQMNVVEEGRTRECRLRKLQQYGGEFTRPWDKFTVNSSAGHPEKATKEKGELIVKALIERLTEVLLELSQTERDASFPY